MKINTWKPQLIFISIVVALLVLLVLTDKSPPKSSSRNLHTNLVVPMPSLGAGPVKLRVVHVLNPRFPGLTPKQLIAVLIKARALVKQNFHINVEFEQPKVLDISDFFALRNKRIAEQVQKRIIDTRSVSMAERKTMQTGLYKTLTSFYHGEAASVVAYARPYLTKPFIGSDLHKLSGALIDTLITRLHYWQQQKAADGKPILDASPYNQWAWWDTIGYGHVPYDVVITNQLVASAETYDMDVHSSLRGGITLGTTSFSQGGKFMAYSFVTSFPMLNDNPVLNLLRSDEHYDNAQIIDYIAALLTHELGHQLLHLSHPFGDKYCVMSPTPLLKFRSWYDQLDPAQCPVGSLPQMTPGAAILDYRVDWLEH